MTAQHALEIYDTIVRLIAAEGDFAVATIVQTDGSCPCPVGARAVFDRDGWVAGTIGGGRLEAEAQRLAQAAITDRHPAILDFSFQGKAAGDDDPICGGAARALIVPHAAGQMTACAEAAEAVRGRRQGALLTQFGGGSACVRFVQSDATDDEPAWLAAAIREAVADQQPLLLAVPGEQPAAEMLVEPLVPKPMLLIVGAGHIGQAVAMQGDLVGFQVTVVDDRPDFATPARFRDTIAVRCGELAEEILGFPIDSDTYVVVATRGHRHDAAALAACAQTPAAYVGMIGSHRKVALMRRDFVESGRLSAEAFDRVHAPIGLDIGAVTVAEIAISIVAQLIAVRRRGGRIDQPPEFAR